MEGLLGIPGAGDDPDDDEDGAEQLVSMAEGANGSSMVVSSHPSAAAARPTAPGLLDSA